MKLKIAVLPGDGIGPEVTAQAVKVINALCRKYNHTVSYTYAAVGADAIGKKGEPYPEETHRICLASDAVLFGAIGDPRFDNDPKARIRPEQGLLTMRRELGLYANIRPVLPFPALLHRSPLREEIIGKADFICIRELTGGIYFGRPQGRSEDGQTAFDSCIYTKEEIRRLCRLGFGYASARRKKLTVIDKANVLATSRLWRETVQELAPQWPEIEVEYMFVDHAAMKLIQQPAHFDVMVTENMFGDILTDEAGAITGSLGLLPSASVGTYTSLFEPIHGSYPQAAGKNIANPIAAILSAAMMFEYAFHLPAEGNAIRQAVAGCLEKGIVTEDISGGKPAYGTEEVGSYIAGTIQ